MAEIEQADLTTLTVELLSAFVSNNTIESGDLAGLIQTTHTALVAINAPAPVDPPAPEFEAAVTVRKSLGSRDHILSLIDGKPYKTLKRHLSGHGLAPTEYRERYKLAADYPMVAPSYSDHRREVAQRLGLGRKSVTQAEAPAEAPEATASPTEATSAPAVPAKSERKAKSKPATERVAKAADPKPAVVDAPSMPDPTEADAAPEPAAKKASPAKSPQAKAKRTAPARSKDESKAAPAKRGRPKAAVATEASE